jgi:hypothetical protein
MSEQLSLSEEHDRWLEEQKARIGKNPMAAKHGLGPEGAKCKECTHITRSGEGRFIKCQIRGISKSTATDHRLSWKACRLFNPTDQGEKR